MQIQYGHCSGQNYCHSVWFKVVFALSGNEDNEYPIGFCKFDMADIEHKILYYTSFYIGETKKYNIC